MDMTLDLPFIWGVLIALAIFLYVVLDGFDLGIGILFPFAPSHSCRTLMMNSIAPFWDGNETWLVLGGGGLFAAFPVAYAILMPAFYIPLLFMVLALIFRGVAFEFRLKGTRLSRFFWESVFHFGSLFAAFCQGVILGGFVQGISVQEKVFSGGPFDWLTPFSLMTGTALIFGYALLGATWMILKTEGRTQKWARQVTRYVLLYVLFFMGLVSLWVPFLDPIIFQRWFHGLAPFYLSPIPLAALWCTRILIKTLKSPQEWKPFAATIGLFTLAYAGLAISFWPWIVPRHISLWEAAAAASSQRFLLVGALCILPLIFFYTGYCYYVFRGKSTHEGGYTPSASFPHKPA